MSLETRESAKGCASDSGFLGGCIWAGGRGVAFTLRMYAQKFNPLCHLCGMKKQDAVVPRRNVATLGAWAKKFALRNFGPRVSVGVSLNHAGTRGTAQERIRDGRNSLSTEFPAPRASVGASLNHAGMRGTARERILVEASSATPQSWRLGLGQNSLPYGISSPAQRAEQPG